VENKGVKWRRRNYYAVFVKVNFGAGVIPQSIVVPSAGRLGVIVGDPQKAGIKKCKKAFYSNLRVGRTL